MKKLLILFIAVIAYGQSAFAQDPAVIVSTKPGWHKIGEVKADFTKESESIVVMGNDKFKAIKLKIAEAPITVSKVVVYFDNETMQNIPVTGTFKVGKETQEFYLQDPTRGITKVVFTYKSEPNKADKKAHVELWGLK
ncbi:MAG: hypothetical protein HOP08_18685 [Cyclobacteriaceae bacterium]|nr:hypothetical protein [Cyclobacteriaceae bacterium]